MGNYRKIDLSNEEFDSFVRGHQNGEFSQLTGWAEVKSDWYSRKVALEKDGTVIAVALLLFRKVPALPYTLCYSPRGFVMDYNDKEAVKEMIKLVKHVAKEEKAFTIKIDPNIERNKYEEIINLLVSEGFKHNGFTKGLVDVQPRFTYMIDLTQSEDEIFNGFTSGTRKSLRKALKSGLFCKEVGKEKLDVFWELMQITGSRDGIQVRNEDYYKRLMNAFDKEKDARLLLIGFKPAEVKAAAEKEIEISKKEAVRLERKLEATKEEKKANLILELKKHDTRQKKADSIIADMDKLIDAGKEEEYLSAGITMVYGEKSYYLYCGSSDQMRDLASSYLLAFESMKFSKALGAKEFDLGGISGIFDEKELEKDDAAGLYLFKRQFGGQLYERVGEFNCTSKPVINALFNLAMKLRGILK